MHRTALRWRHFILVATAFIAASRVGLAAPAASLRSSLFAAITRGDVVQVKRLLAKGVNPNAPSPEGQTPLILAAKLTRIEICAALLAKGADPYRVNADGWNALLIAWHNLHMRSKDDQDMLVRPERKLIHMMLKADAQRHKLPLIGAIEAEDLPAVLHLLASGTNPDEHDSYGWTALMWAAYQGNEDICKVLVAHSAHVNLQDQDGYSALILAASNATLPSHCYPPYLSYWLVDHTPVVEDLLEAGADPNLKDKHGITALANAGRSLRGLGFNHAMCMALIQYGARVDVPGYGGQSLLEIAAYGMDKRLVDILLRRRPTQSDKDAALASANRLHNETVLMDAEHQKEFHQARMEMVQRLLEAGADPRGKDRSGEPTLSLAISSVAYEKESGREIVRLLIAHGADVNARPGLEMTPLMRAIEAGDVEIVRYLLTQGAQVNATAIVHGRTMTALTLAHLRKLPEIIYVLEQAGAQ
jgi:ankyrin repeat protein